MELKSIFIKRGRWYDRTSYFFARKNGLHNIFRTKHSSYGMTIQLAVANQLHLKTTIPLGVSDDGVDLIIGDSIVDVKAHFGSVDEVYKMPAQGMWNKKNNAFLFAHGDNDYYYVLGWMSADEVMAIPITEEPYLTRWGEASSISYRMIPLKSMHPLTELA